MDKLIREKITKILIEKPINLIGTNYDFFCKEAQVYQILFYEHNKVFVSSSGICFNKFGQLLPGSFMHLNRVKKDQKKIALFNLLFRRKQRFNTDKIYFIVHNQWSVNGFYHWVVDSIPRLLSVLNSFKDVVLLLPE